MRKTKQTVFTSLAYGVRGFRYGGCLFDQGKRDGRGVPTPNPLGKAAAEINQSIGAFAPVFETAKSVAVFQTPPLPRSARKPADYWVPPSGDEIVMGEFADPNGNHFLVVANRDAFAPHEAKLRFNDKDKTIAAIAQMDEVTAKWRAAKTTRNGDAIIVTLPLEDAGCKLLAVKFKPAAVSSASAREAEIRVHAKDVMHELTRYMTGACIEDMNREIYGGLYSQMIFGESFQEPANSPTRMWQPIKHGTASGVFALESTNPFLGVQSQRITFVEGEGEIGIENQGLNRWGMSFQAGKPYEGYLWVRAAKPADVFVALESRNGTRNTLKRTCRLRLANGSGSTSFLTPTAADTAGRFAVKLKQPGSVVLGHAMLQPGQWGRFKGLPVRKDVANAACCSGIDRIALRRVDDQRPRVSVEEVDRARDRRPPYKGTWYPYSTNGWEIPISWTSARRPASWAFPISTALRRLKTWPTSLNTSIARRTAFGVSGSGRRPSKTLPIEIRGNRQRGSHRRKLLEAI